MPRPLTNFMSNMRSFAVAHGRYIKALKIEAVLCDALGLTEIFNCSILDIGAGSGHIAAHFAPKNNVIAADIENQLCVEGVSLDFVQLKGASLPFHDASFDVVILNHVLPYIPDHLNALKEVFRILKHTGLCYISLPNRLFPIDPNTHIPLIHYLPQILYSKILTTLTGANENVRMYTLGKMIKLFESAGFSSQDYTIDILHEPAKYHSGISYGLPAWNWMSKISPTNIFILRVKT